MSDRGVVTIGPSIRTICGLSLEEHKGAFAAEDRGVYDYLVLAKRPLTFGENVRRSLLELFIPERHVVCGEAYVKNIIELEHVEDGTKHYELVGDCIGCGTYNEPIADGVDTLRIVPSASHLSR